MTSDLDVRCLNTARDFRGTDAGSLLIQAADEIASLRTHFDQQLSIATEAVAQLERLRAENEALRWQLETILQAADEPACGWYSISEMTIDDARKELARLTNG
jgi:uncharacterized membrane protein YccC